MAALSCTTSRHNHQYLAAFAFELLQGHRPKLLAHNLGTLIVGGCVVKAGGRFGLKGHFFVVVDASAPGVAGTDSDARCSQLARFLQVSEAFGLLQLPFASFALGFLAPANRSC